MSWFNNTALVGFYALGLVAVIASLRVIMLANPVHAILSMIVSLLALAGIFIIIGAPFAGALQVIVYAGAILVLFVFVIMMLNLGVKSDARESRWLDSSVWAVPAGLTFIISVVMYYMISVGNIGSVGSSVEATKMIGRGTVSAKQVGITLFTEYLLLIEVAAMLLLAALVAAYHLGKKALDDENESHSSQLIGQTNNELHSYDNNDVTDAVEYTKPYQYEPIDAAKYHMNNKAKNIEGDSE